MVAAVFAPSREIVVFDIVARRSKQRLLHEAVVYAMSWSRDGKTIASVGPFARPVRMWQIETGKEIDLAQPTLERPRECTTVAISPDGKLLAVGANDGSVRLCDVASGVEVIRLRHPDDQGIRISSVCFSPNGRMLAAGSISLGFKTTARLWDVASGMYIRDIGFPYPLPSPDVDSTDPVARKRARDELQRKIDLLPRRTYCLAFSCDNRILATSQDNALRLWEVQSGYLRLEAKSTPVQAAFLPSGPLATTSEQGAVSISDWSFSVRLRPANLSNEDFEALWSDLGSDNHLKYSRALTILATNARGVVATLGRRIRPIEPVTELQAEQLIKDLDDPDFDVRERASRRLRALNNATRCALLKARSAKSLSPDATRRIEDLLARINGPVPPDRLRVLRAIEALERINTAEARSVLGNLAKGATNSVETEEARAALARIGAAKPPSQK
jgi:WD40 repeat protein